MISLFRRLTLVLGVVVLLGGASAAYADSFELTFTSGLTGVLNLTATPQGGGFLVTSVTGSENGLKVGGIISPDSSGFYPMSDGDGYLYDDMLFPSSQPVFDNGGLLFTLVGSNGLIFENLYSIGSSAYLESAYLHNGLPFPWDFNYVPVTFKLSDPPPVAATPEPSIVVLCLAGLAALAFAIRRRKLVSQE